EVARLSGLDEIPSALPARVSARAVPNTQRVFLKNTREVMLGAGLDEVRTLAFTAPADNSRFPGIASACEPIKVQNPLSAELSELRRSMLPGLTAALQFNLHRQAEAFHAFEIGKVFALRAGAPTESLVIAGLSYGSYVMPAIGQKAVDADFFSM